MTDHPIGCNKPLIEGEHYTAYYLRPTLEVDWFGLQARCLDCRRFGCDYVIGVAPAGLRCGSWVDYEPGTETFAPMAFTAEGLTS